MVNAVCDATTMQEKIVVVAEASWHGLITKFLSNTREYSQSLQNLVEHKKFKELRYIGHNWKGTGGSYGFDEITYFGDAIERAALEEQADSILDNAKALINYLDRLEVVYQ